MITGSRLAQLRKENNMVQKDLADRLSVAVSTISNYENSVNSIDISTLNKLADFFGVTTDYLIGRTNYRESPEDLYQQNYNDIYVREITDTVLTLDDASRAEVLKYVRYIAAQSPKKQ